MVNSEDSQTSGKLVALEGDIGTISTQLRLLPPSQKILVLPPIRETLPRDAEESPFDARAFVRSVHMLFSEQTEIARSFLRSSTSLHPKLVLMNGGSASATATCITKIGEKLTNGGFEEAEKIFNDIVRGGVQVLLNEDENSAQEVGAVTPLEVDTDLHEHSEGRGEGNSTHTTGVPEPSPIDNVPFPSLGHPGSNRLSRLSSSLEPITIRLMQPMDNDSENSERGPIAKEEGRTRKHSPLSSLPTPLRTVVTMQPPSFNLQDKLSAFGPWSAGLETPSTANTSYSRFLAPETDDEDEEEFDFETDLPSLVDDFCSSAPITPHRVIFGEARLVDMQPPRVQPIRVQSYDAYRPSSSSVQGADSQVRVLRNAKSEGMLGSRPATSEADVAVLSRIGDSEKGPKSTLVRASQTTVKQLCRPSSLTSFSHYSITPCTSRIFVDRGTDAEEVKGQVLSQVAEEPPGHEFKPVFPAIEDLVIVYKDSNPDSFLHSVVHSFKQGTYPIRQDEASIETPMSISQSASDPADCEVTLGRRASHLTTRTDDSGYDSKYEFDPYVRSKVPTLDTRIYIPGLHGSNQARNDLSSAEASIPVMCRLSSSGEPAEKYITFSPPISANLIGVQNSLRHLFADLFPGGENGFSQYYYPVASGMDRLWKPAFGTHSEGTSNETSAIDQILAVGCEEGVESNLHAQITGQVERLGMKRCGLSRSGKVDISYLIGNLMQSCSGIGTGEAAANPLSDPELLATLLVPQIEAYMASNPTSRFLILKYSWDYLSTVLELRKIIGSNFFQVAGVLDSFACEPSSRIPHSKNLTPLNPFSTDATENRNKQQGVAPSQKDQPETPSYSHISSSSSLQASASKRSSVSFSKANFVLPSAATEAEISNFLISISQVLIEKSPFYRAEPEIKPVIIERPPLPPTPTTPPYSHRDRDREPTYPPPFYRTPREVRDSKISRLTGTSLSTSRQTRYSYTPSIVSSIRTTATERGRREDKEWENFYIAEEDSDDDEYDRMILGRAMAKIVPEARKPFAGPVGPKRSTKKALKWLGLA